MSFPSSPDPIFNPQEWVLIGRTLKPYGLLGEIKVKPESFDLERHGQLNSVLFHKQPFHQKNDKGILLPVSSSRLHQRLWYLKFKGFKTPESLKTFSGGYLYIPEKERLKLPQNMFYMTDIIGYTVYDISNHLIPIGTITQIQEHPTQEILVIKPISIDSKELLIPWIDIFVKEIDQDTKMVLVDIEVLKGLYEN